MAVNTGVVVGTVGIVTLGILKATFKQAPITPIIIGGYVAGLFASLIDLIPGAAPIAGGIMLLAFVATLATDTWWLGLLNVGSISGAYKAKTPPEQITQTRTNPATGG